MFFRQFTTGKFSHIQFDLLQQEKQTEILENFREKEEGTLACNLNSSKILNLLKIFNGIKTIVVLCGFLKIMW